MRIFFASACLFCLACLVCAEDKMVSVGGINIVLPAPEGFFRYDGKSAKVDASSQQTTASGNRLLAEFSPEDTLADVLADRFPISERFFNAQSVRSVESLAVTPAVFNEMKPVLRSTFTSPTEFRNVVNDIETRVSVAVGSSLKKGEAIPLGIFEETPDSLCFSVLMKEQVDGSDNLVVIQACSVVRVNNRVLALYSTSQDGIVRLYLAMSLEPLAQFRSAKAAFRAIYEQQTGYQPWDSIDSRQASLEAKERSRWRQIGLGQLSDPRDRILHRDDPEEIPPPELL